MDRRIVFCRQILLAAIVAVFAGFLAPCASAFEARLASVAIEGGEIKGLSADARAELAPKALRRSPFEVKYWRQAPIKKELRKRYPEMGYAG